MKSYATVSLWMNCYSTTATVLQYLWNICVPFLFSLCWILWSPPCERTVVSLSQSPPLETSHFVIFTFINNFFSTRRCGYITVDSATVASQNGVCITQQMCHIIILLRDCLMVKDEDNKIWCFFVIKGKLISIKSAEWCSRCKNHSYVAAPIRAVFFILQIL